ncbi:hypothetical protein TWF718_009266 [Orbilia javanica]|uniref:BTB domain-containing protein n=1 Tax=Orbilia javanica TaxID=47235 RepID=A0AAN8RCG6_9PEZI
MRSESPRSSSSSQPTGKKLESGSSSSYSGSELVLDDECYSSSASNSDSHYGSEIAAGGDLETVLVCSGGEELGKSSFITSSQAISLASPKLQSLIANERAGIEENNTSASLSIDLETNSKEAGRIVLNIIHHIHDKDAESPDLKTLYDIATFCERYSLERAVYPTMTNWINLQWSQAARDSCVTLKNADCSKQQERAAEQEKDLDTSGKSSSHPHASSECEKWLWIAKVFDIDRILAMCGYEAVFNCLKLPEPHAKKSRGRYNFRKTRIPDGFDSHFKVIMRFRERMVTQLMENLDVQAERYSKAVANKEYICNQPDTNLKKECDVWQMGILFKVKAKLDSSDNMTLKEICECLKDLGPEEEGGCHGDCNLANYFSFAASEVETADFRQDLMDSFRGL